MKPLRRHVRKTTVSCDWRRPGHVTTVLTSDWSGAAVHRAGAGRVAPALPAHHPLLQDREVSCDWWSRNTHLWLVEPKYSPLIGQDAPPPAHLLPALARRRPQALGHGPAVSHDPYRELFDVMTFMCHLCKSELLKNSNIITITNDYWVNHWSKMDPFSRYNMLLMMLTYIIPGIMMGKIAARYCRYYYFVLILFHLKRIGVFW